ncbi:MAG: rRNA maturation RNase YbeY [Fimbriimonadales bacterium]
MNDIVIIDRTRRVRRNSFLKAALEALLEAEDQPPSTVEILLTDEDEIRTLNREFRGIDAVTDVLSFPSGDGPEDVRLLGEIAVCVQVAEEQALARRVTLESELACLAVHGALHLLGYEDETEAGRREMIDKMDAVVTSCGHAVADDWGSIYAKR